MNSHKDQISNRGSNKQRVKIFKQISKNTQVLFVLSAIFQRMKNNEKNQLEESKLVFLIIKWKNIVCLFSEKVRFVLALTSGKKMVWNNWSCIENRK